MLACKYNWWIFHRQINKLCHKWLQKIQNINIEYTSYKGADNNILFKDVVLEEVPFDSIYITTQFDGMYSNGNKKGFEFLRYFIQKTKMASRTNIDFVNI